jgi:hypothetical protein
MDDNDQNTAFKHCACMDLSLDVVYEQRSS